VGGGGQHKGFEALDYHEIHQGNAGKLGNYPILSVLPDKFARFLFEYHAHRFESLDLPELPADRSDFDVHGALLDDKVRSKCHTQLNSKSFKFVETIIHIIQIITTINIMTRNPNHNVRYIQCFLETSIDFLAQRSAHQIMVGLTCV
jgi:hypothetical protein